MIPDDVTELFAPPVKLNRRQVAASMLPFATKLQRLRQL